MKRVMNQKTFEQGFTLLEVVIVTAIFAILMIGLLNLYDWHNRVYSIHRADTQATGSARVAMNNISHYTAQASQVLTSRTISGTTYTTDSDTVVLRLPAYDGSGNLLTNTYDHIVYNLIGTELSQIVELGSGSSRRPGNKLLSGDVQTLSITYNNGDVTLANKVTVDLQTRAVSRGTSVITAHVTDTIFLRNFQWLNLNTKTAPCSLSELSLWPCCLCCRHRLGHRLWCKLKPVANP